MKDRKRAISILKQARDVLAERVTQRVLAAQAEIMDDAHGNTYLGEIEALYDELGSRLQNVNLLLANLSAGEEKSAAPASNDKSHNDESSNDKTAFSSVVADMTSQAPSEPSEADPEVTFADFGRQIAQGDVAAAGQSLSLLFDVDEERGRRCAERFYEQLQKSPEIMTKAMQLRQELATGSFNGAMMLLWECFGLQGPESLSVAQTLKTRL